MPEELPVHPVTGLTALGVLSSGRIVWPVLGAAPEDDDADGDAGDGGTGDDSGESGQDGDGLGDRGREALRKEREARKAEAKARKAAEAELADLKAKAAAGAQQDETQKAVDQARRDAEQAATAKANARILSAEVRAAAAGKLADPSDAARYLDMSEFEVGDDGSVDSDAIAEAISDLIKQKPYLAAKAQGFQGTGDGGARTGGSRSKQLTGADLKTMTAPQIAEARRNGQLAAYMSGG